MWSSRTRQGCIRRPSGAPSSVNGASAAVLGGVTVLSNSAHLSRIEVHIEEAGPSEQSRFSGNGFLCGTQIEKMPRKSKGKSKDAGCIPSVHATSVTARVSTKAPPSRHAD